MSLPFQIISFPFSLGPYYTWTSTILLFLSNLRKTGDLQEIVQNTEEDTSNISFMLAPLILSC